MKRTPLKRKTPLKRSAAMNPMSPSKRAIQSRYKAAVRDAMHAQIGRIGFVACERCCKTAAVEPHHPEGRIGDKILIIRLICRKCHKWIHENTKQARLDGWLK